MERRNEVHHNSRRISLRSNSARLFDAQDLSECERRDRAPERVADLAEQQGNRRTEKQNNR